MLVKDTTVNDKPLNAVVIPEVMVRDGFEFKICLKRKTTTLRLFLLEVNENTFYSKEPYSKFL